MFLPAASFPRPRRVDAMLTFPLGFPGVVVGFMIILLAGRQGFIGDSHQSPDWPETGLRLFHYPASSLATSISPSRA